MSVSADEFMRLVREAQEAHERVDGRIDRDFYQFAGASVFGAGSSGGPPKSEIANEAYQGKVIDGTARRIG